MWLRRLRIWSPICRRRSQTSRPLGRGLFDRPLQDHPSCQRTVRQSLPLKSNSIVTCGALCLVKYLRQLAHLPKRRCCVGSAHFAVRSRYYLCEVVNFFVLRTEAVDKNWPWYLDLGATLRSTLA